MIRDPPTAPATRRTGCSAEAAEAPRPSPPARAHHGERGAPRRGAARARPPRGGHLRARQLRPRGDLRQVPDRDARRRAHRLGRALGELGLRQSTRTCAAASSSPSRSRAAAPTCSRPPRAARARRRAAWWRWSTTRTRRSPRPPTACSRCAPVPRRAWPPPSRYIASLAALLHVVAAWTVGRRADGRRSPRRRTSSSARGRSTGAPRLPTLAEARSLFVIGARRRASASRRRRRSSCKETGGLHAEAFSGAEVRHGPQALLQAAFPGAALRAGRRGARGPGRARARTWWRAACRCSLAGVGGARRARSCRRSPRIPRSQPLLRRAELLPPRQRAGARARPRSRPARRTCAR